MQSKLSPIKFVYYFMKKNTAPKIVPLLPPQQWRPIFVQKRAFISAQAGQADETPISAQRMHFRAKNQC
jgi:hypothetical protein